MCGICGIFEPTGALINSDEVDRMASVIAHRGPDGEGHYLAPGIALGHRRLAIIDPAGGGQPISNESGEILLVANCEIYNFVELRDELTGSGHRFRTRSDAEVMVHAYEQWGTAAVTRLNGMFAFALWDGARRRLLLARDHLGIKPLYYVWVGQRLLFASEIKPLLSRPECPREVDLEALAQLFTLGYVASPKTLFQGIMKLPPGHLMTASAEGCEVRRYWGWRPRRTVEAREEVLVEEYQSLIEDAVRLQMRSDVPVGLFLSSGVDSGALLAMMSDWGSRPVQAFTVGFVGGEATNEVTQAKEVAHAFGAQHTDCMIAPEDYQAYFERYLADLEEPVGDDTAAAFYFVSRLSAQQVKTVLCGQGADELWAGYRRYQGLKLSGVYSRLPRSLTGRVIASVLAKAPSEALRRGSSALAEPDVFERLIQIYSFYDVGMKQQLFRPWLKAEIGVNGVSAKAALGALHNDVASRDALTQMLYIDARASLPEDLLMVADKTSMANSLEVRVPYLDHRVVEFVESLPPQLKLRGFEGKYLHKRALAKWLPSEVLCRKKKGFSNPIEQWLRVALRPYLGDCLLSERARVHRYFEPSYIRRLVQEHETGRGHYLRHLHLLMAFELWHQTFLSN